MADTDNTTYDFIVVGSGACSVPVALTAKEAGKSVLIIEKTDGFGGSTAMSGGVIWIPNNKVILRSGAPDTLDKARAYLAACAGDVGEASTKARQEKFLTEGPAVIDVLDRYGFKFVFPKGYADYYENERPGGLATGRSLLGAIFDLNKLGKNKSMLRRKIYPPVILSETPAIMLNGRTLKSCLMFAKAGFRMMQNKLLGRDLVGFGQSIQGQLLLIALQNDIPIWLNSPVTDLVSEGGRVTGVKVTRDGKEIVVNARSGVLLDTGGFSHNPEMLDKYQPGGAAGRHTLSNPGDTGDGIRMAQKLGAKTGIMDMSWWLPSSSPPNAPTATHSNDLPKPHCILVDASGKRFVNEATSYVDIGLALNSRTEKANGYYAWMVMDRNHRHRYRLGGVKPGKPSRAWVESGYMKVADTLDDLARQIGVDAAALKGTVDRFNGFARKGADEDFGKGRGAFHNWFGDPTNKPNVNLGPIDTGPFYAIGIHVGDVGSSGGVITDELARVIKEDGTPIQGLYATGNTTATVVGYSYPGAGASIGASMAFGHIAVRHALGLNS